MAIIDAMDVLKNPGTPVVVPVPVPTNEVIYEVAGDVGKRTLWSASSRGEGVGTMLTVLSGSSLFSWSSRRWASTSWRSVSLL